MNQSEPNNAEFAEGEVADEVAQPTAMVKAEPQLSIKDAIATRTGGAASREVVTGGYDASTPEGAQTLMRHVQASTPPNTKADAMNKELNLVAFTIRRVLCKKAQDGTVYDPPITLFRTLMEMEDGTMIASSSDFVAQDILMIHDSHKDMSFDKPVVVMLRKGGSADRLIDVKASAPRKMLAKKK